MKLTDKQKVFEKRLQEDPRQEEVRGVTGPREYLFTVGVVEWIYKLSPQPSEALVLAGWGHVMDRWALPRNTYPMTRPGYHQWRRAQAKMSADRTDEILGELETDEATRKHVRELILKTTFPTDPDSQVLEDATCLMFIETKLESYLADWDEVKSIRILAGTLEKMTDQAKELAMKMPLSENARMLIGKALNSKD